MRFLIVKTSALGDIIHAFSALAYLRKRFPKPDHQIDWAVEKPFAELVRAHPEVDETLTIQTKDWRKGLNLKELLHFRRHLRRVEYDAVFDLQANFKSGFFVTLQAKSPNKIGFDFRTVHEWPNAFFTNRRFNPPPGKNIREDYLSIVAQYFQENEAPAVNLQVQLKVSHEQQAKVQEILSHPLLQNRAKVMVCPGSAWKNKQMPSDGLINLLSDLQKKSPCAFLFIWGNSEERIQAADLQKHFHETSLVVDRLSIPALQNLMSAMDLVVSMDSLPLHLAGTTGRPTLGVFGPSSSQKYQPCGSQHFAFQGSCPYKKEFPMRCKILRTCSTGLCMQQLNGHEVFESFNNR